MSTSSDYPTSMTAVPGQVNELKSIPQPPESKYKGSYRNKSDGYVYRHCVFDHPNGKTHKAMITAQYNKDIKDEKGNPILVHSGLFWEGTQEEFEAEFRRE